MIKKTSLIAVTFFSMIGMLIACWFNSDHINGYIAGANYFLSHVEEFVIEAKTGNVTNNLSVSLPLTLWFKVEPRRIKVNGVDVEYQINRTTLYYKIIPNGQADDNLTSKWRVAKTIDMTGQTWDLKFDELVKLFGTRTLTKRMIIENGDTINAGDSIIFVWQLEDNSEQAVMNGPDITPNSNLPHIVVRKQ